MSGPGPAATIFTFPGAWDEIDAHYQERGWTDGLPIVPPTETRVRELLKQTARDPREVVGVLPPRQGEATIEKIAANAVMAGCRPEYFPVVLAAIEALADPLFNLDSVQATTHPVAPLIVVNGPIARAIEHARFPLKRLGLEYQRQQIERWSVLDAPDTMILIVRRPEDLSVIVVGGAGKHSCWQPTFGDGTHWTRRTIARP